MHDVGGARIRVDRRGHWLLVDEGGQGVHVNGRPVRRIAMLRAGDSLHVDGGAILLAAAGVAPPPPAPEQEAGGAPDVRVVLRAIGGRHHGRSFTLDRPRVIGSDPGADIRLDPPLPGQHARIANEQGRVVLRATGGGVTQVNGVDVRDAGLSPGDQLLFAGRDRFVLEAPCEAPLLPGIGPLDAMGRGATGDDGVAVPGRPPRRLPWLLLAALLIAAAISALLLL